MNAELFRATLAKYQKLRHIDTLEQLRAHTTCGSSTTFRKWLQDPNLIPIGEWENLMNALRVPKAEQIEILLEEEK